MTPTHEVLNQPPPLVDYDLFGADAALQEAVEREGAGWASAWLHDLGALAGSAEAIEWGVQANANPPVLHTHDRFGSRVDRVEYHPAYHRLMNVAVDNGLHAGPWEGPEQRAGAGRHVARAAGFFLWSQVDAGHGCPISMTYSVLPALGATPALLEEWKPRLTSRQYDPTDAPAGLKAGALAGMGMTEKQGGSDVRAGTTRAEQDTDGWWLTGHKWFFSAPMGDVFLVLAQAPGGLSCFAVPRYRPDGVRNALQLQRLKDKLGNRSNASSEVEFVRAWGQLLGEEGRGVATIIQMVNHTRLDCTLGAASGTRQAVAQACHHARHRRAFGRDLVDQPLMTAVLADLVVESEAATALAFRLARAYDQAEGSPSEDAFRRLATAAGKYWVCKRHPPLAAEALECLGGNGYVEESIMPRLLRESPLNGIWEGSGNVICLDVLRAMARTPESLEAVMDEIRPARGADRRLDQAAARLDSALATTAAAVGGGRASEAEAGARRLVEQLVLVLQGALLVRHGHPAVADAFCASRLEEDTGGRMFGTMPSGLDHHAIVERAPPPSLVAEAVDPDRLAQVLTDAGVLGDRSVVVRELQQLSGGASRQTWSLLACPADGDAGSAGGRRLVLRQEPPDMASIAAAGGAAEAPAMAAADGRADPAGMVLPGMSTEVACLQAAARQGVPVPRLVACSDDPSVLGGEFMVMDHVDGETIPRRILRDERFAVARARLVEQCAQALAGIHRVGRQWVPGVPDVDPLERLRVALDGIGEPHPVFELALRWLDRNRPPAGADGLVHGDFRTGNLIVDESGLAAVIDWERAHWGDPVEDLAWLCVRAWRFGGPGEVGGFGDRDQLLAAYRAAGGVPLDEDRLEWWLVFGTLDWGVICGMMARRHLALGLRSVELAAIGRRAAAQEWDLLDLLEPKLQPGHPAAAGPGPTGATAEADGTMGEGGRGPHDRPSAAELVAAVRAFLEDEVLPGTAGGGSRDRFLTRVAISALGIAERELALGPAHDARHAARLAALGVGDDTELAARIRAGDWDTRFGALLDPLREAVTDKLVVANPALLGR